MADDGRFSTLFVADGGRGVGHFLVEHAPAHAGLVERVRRPTYPPAPKGAQGRNSPAENRLASSREPRYGPAAVLSMTRPDVGPPVSHTTDAVFRS